MKKIFSFLFLTLAYMQISNAQFIDQPQTHSATTTSDAGRYCVSYIDDYFINTHAQSLKTKGEPIFFEDFEKSPSDYTFPTGWTNVPTPGGREWKTQPVKPPIGLPMQGHSGKKYASIMYHNTVANNAWVYTPAITLTADSSYLISFWVLLPGYQGVAEKLEVKIGTAPNSSSMSTLIYDNNGADFDTWKEIVVIFTPTTTGSYFIGFHSYSPAANNISLFDDVCVKPALTNDMIVHEIIQPNSWANLTNAETVSARIRNDGTAPVSSFDLQLFVNNTLIATEPVTVSLPSTAEHTYTFTTKADLSAVQAHEIKVVVKHSGDLNADNDTLIKSISNYGDVIIMGNESIVTSCNRTFLDDGAYGNYSGYDPEQIISFLPDNADHKMSVTFTQYNTITTNDMLGHDILYVLNGHFTDPYSFQEKDVLAALKGNLSASLPMTFTAFNADGALSFVFRKNNTPGMVATGWEASVDCISHSEHDAGVASIISPASGGNATASVSVQIRNAGTTPISNMDIYYQINNGTPVKETYSGNIAPFTTVNFTFSQTANLSEYQDYTIIAYTDLANDGDRTNDTAQTSFRYDGSVKLYGYRMFDVGISNTSVYAFVSFTSNNTNNVTVHKQYLDDDSYIQAGVYYNEKLYAFSHNVDGPANFITFDDTWSVLASRPNSIPAISATFNYITNQIFILSSTNQLVKMDINTGETTTITLSDHFAAIACNKHGELYGISIISTFYSINHTNGNCTLIGSTDVPHPSYIQSMAFDHQTDRLFWAYCATATGILYEIDPATGQAINMGVIGNNAEIAMLYIPYSGNDISDYTYTNIHVYPNPATDKVTIKGGQNSDMTIYDITGRALVRSRLQNEQEDININSLLPGMYIIELHNAKTKTTHKLIKK